MSKVVAVELAQHHAIRTEKSGRLNLPFIGPARRAIGLDILGLARTPDRHANRYGNRNEGLRRRDEGTFDKDLRRISVIDEPPPEEDRRVIDLPARQFEPSTSELRLVGEPPGRPLGRSPDGEQNDQADNDHLAPEDFGSGHLERPLRNKLWRTQARGRGRASDQNPIQCHRRLSRRR